MANKSVFKGGNRGVTAPATDAVNHAGGKAYKTSDKHALAQFAVTGCFNYTYYASAEDQMDNALQLAQAVDPAFVGKVAVYSREKAHMKDMPAFLLATLSLRDNATFKKVFPRVATDGKMLRNVVQILRSGKTGRKSLGTAPKKQILAILNGWTDEQLFKNTVGNDPSLVDVIKMVHPKPLNPGREALYGYLLGKKHNAEVLPELVKQFEAFKAGTSLVVPNVPFQMLTALNLGTPQWTAIAQNVSWQTLRMNLNTFQRHDVFKNEAVVNFVAAKLANKEEILKARVFPYQLMIAFMSVSAEIPKPIKLALQQAMEHAVTNVPALEGKTVYVFPDVSGSMRSPATGHRKGATTAVRCVDIAGLVSAAFLRKNPLATVIPFEQEVHPVDLNPMDSVMTNATKLAAVGGGGTNCSAPLAQLNRQNAKGDLIIYISDNESWVDGGYRTTGTMEEWNKFKSRNPKAKLVCIDITPNRTAQVTEHKDILLCGGFSDNVFSVIDAFVGNTENNPDYFVNTVENAVTL